MRELLRAMSDERWAQVGITVQFMALVRILVEYYRVRATHGSLFGRVLVLNAHTLGSIMAPSLITAVLCWVAVTLYFFRRYKATAAFGAATVVVLLIYKFFIL